MVLISFNMNYLLFRCLRNRRLSLHFYSSDVRVRFAPSPTGYLHLGGLRTALYNFLLAKSQNGKFILRIEDTDRKRLVDGAAAALENDLKWVGLEPDESPLKGGDYGPYVQSERTDLYQKEAQRLIDNGTAYYCFCSERRLEMLRKNAVKNHEVPKYDNRCRHLSQEDVLKRLNSNGEKCVRFKLSHGEGFSDLIYGQIHYLVEDVEGDPVILKKDGLPTYHLASVIDDYYMKISHVIRGVEWLQSTDKHLMIYRALGYPPPIFAHLPLLLNSDGSKLSKRQGDITVQSLRLKGVEPRAIVNFLSLVGGGFTNKPRDTLSLEELTKYFNINLVMSNSCKLPLERLDYYNKSELIRLINDPQEMNNLVSKLKSQLTETLNKKYNLQLDNDYIENVLKCFSHRISYLGDLLDKNLMFLWFKPNLNNLDKDSIDLLKKLLSKLENSEFTKEILSPIFKEFSIKHNISFKKLMHLLRSVICGIKEGPGVAEIMELLGKEITLERISAAVHFNENGDLRNQQIKMAEQETKQHEIEREKKKKVHP